MGWPGRLTLPLAAMVLVAAGAAQDTAPAAPQAPDTAPVADTTRAAARGAPVVVARDTLFRILARAGPLSPAERAERIAARLAQASQDLAGGRDTLALVSENGQTLIAAGDLVIMAVTDQDADSAGVPRDTLAASYLAILRDAVTRGSLEWRLRRIVIGVLLTLLATAVTVGLGWLLRKAGHRSRAGVRAFRSGGRIPSIRIQRFEVVSAARLAEAGLGMVRGVEIVLWAVLLYFYLVLVLSFFPWTAAASERILYYVLQPLGVVARAIVEYLPNLFFIAVIVLVTRFLLRFIHLIFRAIGSGAIALPGFYPDWAEPTYKLVRFLVLAFALVVLFPYLPGSDSPAFQGVSIFLGVLLSLGSTGAVANVVSGTMLTYTRSFQVGDRVRIGETVGDVLTRTLLVTRVRTVTNVDVTIPNSAVMSSHVLNYSAMARQEGVILQTTVSIGYDAPWRQVHDLLIAAARGTQGVEQEPAPFVVQTGLSDYYPTYELNAYTRDAHRMRRILSGLNERIQDCFFEAGVEITSPAFTAIRDGNRVTLPPEHLPPGYDPPAFRVQQTGGPRSGRTAGRVPERNDEGPSLFDGD